MVAVGEGGEGGESGKLLFSRYRVSVCKMESSGGQWWGWSHNSVNVLNATDYTLRKSKMVNIMLCIFCHN